MCLKMFDDEKYVWANENDRVWTKPFSELTLQVASMSYIVTTFYKDLLQNWIANVLHWSTTAFQVNSGP